MRYRCRSFSASVGSKSLKRSSDQSMILTSLPSSLNSIEFGAACSKVYSFSVSARLPLKIMSFISINLLSVIRIAQSLDILISDNIVFINVLLVRVHDLCVLLVCFFDNFIVFSFEQIKVVYKIFANKSGWMQAIFIKENIINLVFFNEFINRFNYYGSLIYFFLLCDLVEFLDQVSRDTERSQYFFHVRIYLHTFRCSSDEQVRALVVLR